MSGIILANRSEGRAAGGAALFLRRWPANALQMGSVIPSSPALGRRVARPIERARDEVAVEPGAGTGAISRAQLANGVPADRLVVVEIVPEMAMHLARTLPGVTVVEGDAFALREALPAALHGRVGTAICGIPLVLLPTGQQRRFVAAVEAVAPGRGFLLYSYCVTSPLPMRALGLTGRREARMPLNFPPASIWRYRPAV